MVVEAFIYMFFVGFGTALGVAAAALISFKVWQRMKSKTNRKRKGAAF
ncbi:hypothetical protein [Peribacillus sp. TH24]|nr:hypothetical protein [Peribacillus sp. TH24]MBK5447025.1 hypothetical protein [Peribacillus sp. TH24]MBK5447056.1 hypothetical protein [Peribacillus sp. TH24]